MEQNLNPLRWVEDHEKYFNPKDYLNPFNKSPECVAKEGDLHLGTFFVLNYHNFWSSFGSNNLTVLEFGGGPSIYPLISASPFLSEIVFAEFLEANRREVEFCAISNFTNVDLQTTQLGNNVENIGMCRGYQHHFNDSLNQLYKINITSPKKTLPKDCFPSSCFSMKVY